MNLTFKAAASILIAASISGCVNYSPTNPKVVALHGKELYGQVNSFFTSIDRACSDDQNHGSPFCANKPLYVWTGALIGQHAFGTLQKVGLAVPKNVNVKEGDIIAYHLANGHPWAVFDRIAAREAEQGPGSSCRWEGSHFFSGGVVCDGWRWDKDYSFLAD